MGPGLRRSAEPAPPSPGPYQEWPAPLPGVVLWHRPPVPEGRDGLVLPDGCLDLIWDGTRLFVAGPDSTARPHRSPAGTGYTALRFAGGTGPGLLGVPAHLLLDRTPYLDELWPDRTVRELTERVAGDPAGELTAWLCGRTTVSPPDPWGARVLALVEAGLGMAAIAGRLGISGRQLHRRCVPVFGYGPARLARIVRLGAALRRARAGLPLAEVAARSGYADQAHLCRDTRALAGTTPAALVAGRTT